MSISKSSANLVKRQELGQSRNKSLYDMHGFKY